jgi:hypothetical protein
MRSTLADGPNFRDHLYSLVRLKAYQTFMLTFAHAYTPLGRFNIMDPV